MKSNLCFLCLQFGKVFRGLWRGTSVAVKKMVLPSCHGPRAAEAEKVSGEVVWAPILVLHLSASSILPILRSESAWLSWRLA